MWAQIINTVLGFWLMAAPALLGFGGSAADNDHIIGPVVSSLALIAIWEATRNVRWLNIPLGAWLLLAPWVLGYESGAATTNDLAVGALIILFSLQKGKVDQRFGGGWRSLWQSDALHMQEAGKQQP